MSTSSSSKIPAWIISCLEQYGNCACGYRITKQLGKQGLLDTLESMGYPYELEIIGEPKEDEELPADGTYILTLHKPSSASEESEEEEEAQE
ncbi:hypothetical protein [Allobaculum sp. Allo2]|uniref:hypothetical protein n=1 Tax=Allobaculum sp. Allo2 TaxID=2853432 RepID=UPI001F6132EF|nr:hypothetical protein [Allobaculum sp. Allo2]UNT92799.1 hypothetical protein KWG61_12010 [Allobaculum sp. Allo2]